MNYVRGLQFALALHHPDKHNTAGLRGPGVTRDVLSVLMQVLLYVVFTRFVELKQREVNLFLVTTVAVSGLSVSVLAVAVVTVAVLPLHAAVTVLLAVPSVNHC